MKSFEDIFNVLLENDIVGSKPTPRHRRGIAAPHIGAKSQHAVPDVHRIDASLNQKVELLRGKPFGKVMLNDVDLKDIMQKYNIRNVSPEEPRELGTTKITLHFDGPTQKYCLSK